MIAKHKLVVEVVSEVDRGQRQMQNRLIRWIEAYGHTAAGFGFSFRAVGVITGKLVQMEERSARSNRKDVRSKAATLGIGRSRRHGRQRTLSDAS